ncbi:MAG: exonuclease SbcCD subunit D, partial [Fusobacterium polymorphum]
MKIVHCSDLHLGKRPSGTKDYVTKRYMDFFNAFAAFVDKVEEIKPDVCLIAGDIFDKKEINPDSETPVYISSGDYIRYVSEVESTPLIVFITIGKVAANSITTILE